MGKTKDLGHLAHIVAYNAENHITVPAGITMHTNQLVASQAYVTTALSSYALSSALGSYVPTSRTITINGTSYDLSANRSWDITSMIYPAAGIALSTGSAWGTSITNNSENWNTAYGWGNHASAGYATTSSLSSYLLLAGGTLTGALSGTSALFTGNLRTDTGLGLKYGSFVSTSGYLNLFSAIIGSTMTLNLKDGTGGYEIALTFPASANRSYTFPAANGTIALTSDIPSLSGYVPTSRTITINGTTLDLSANRSFTVTATETDTLATVTGRGATTSTALSLSGRVTFGSAIADRPQIPGGMVGLDTGDGNFDIWGISRDYYPSNPSTSNAWGLRWNGTNNDFEFVGAGTSRVILDMDSGNVTATGTISASNLSGTNTGDQTNISGNAATVSNGVYTNSSQNNLSGVLNFGSSGAAPYNNPTGTSNGISFGGIESSSLRTYGIFTEQENIGGNYSKLTINYHTGIRLGASSSYGGTRFYNNFAGGSGGGGEIFSIGNGDNNIRATATIYAAGYRGNANVGGTGEATWHPAGIYSGGTQWLYGTTYRNNANTSGQGQMYFDGNYGYGMVGLYASTRYQAIFAMGDSYKLPVDGTTTGSLYGLAWSHPNAGGVASNLNTHGLLVMENGTFLAAVSGSIRARDDMRAPIFYDSNDTGYYLDPNSESNLYRFTAATMTRNAINYLSINSPFTTRAAQGTPYQNGTIGWSNVDFNTVFSNWGSGFIDTWSSPGNAPGGSSHYVGLQGCHYNHQNSTNVYGFQMACAGEADNRFFWRSAWPSIRGWVEMVHSGNILSFSTSGNSANTIVRRDGSGDIAIGTLNTSHAYFGGGGRGLTSADTYGSYGNVHTYGTGQNGYSGYGIYTSSGYRTFFMAEGGNYGIYAQDWAKWAFYFSAATQSYSIGSSEPVAGYTLYLIYGLYTVGLYNASDARMKKNVLSLSNSLDKVKQLRGVSYEYIDKGDDGTKNKGLELGFIAQEVLPVIPELIRYDEKKGYAMNYNGVSAVLVEAIKEQQVQIESQQNQINTLILQLTELLNK